jgi:hypothetical protein
MINVLIRVLGFASVQHRLFFFFGGVSAPYKRIVKQFGGREREISMGENRFRVIQHSHSLIILVYVFIAK